MWSALGFSSDKLQADTSADAPAPAPAKAIDRKAMVMPVSSTSVVEEKDLKWVVEHSSATEGQTWYIHMADGGFTFVQIVYSTMGLSASVQVSARYYGCDGVKKSKSLSLSSSSFQLSEDKLSVNCENISVNFIKGTGYTIKLDMGSELSYDFKFEPTDGFVKTNSGKFQWLDDEAGGYVTSVFCPMAIVTGTITVDGKNSSVDGSGFYVNAFQMKPQCVGKWNFVNIHSEKNALMLYEFEMPGGYEYKLDIVSQGFLVRNGKTIAVTTDNRSIQLKKEYDAFSGYQIPNEFSIRWSGKTTDGSDKDVNIELALVPSNQIDKIDVLSELPWVLRTIIQTFITAPFLYSWYEKPKLKVSVGDDSFEMDGRMFLELSFLTQMN